MLFIEYPKCSTCKKAKKFLEDNNLIMKKILEKLVKEKPHGGASLKWNMGRLLFRRIQ